AINGPSATVIAGDAAAIDEVLAAYQADDVRARRVPVTYASHSPHVEAIRDRVIEAAASIAPQAGDVAFYSTGTGGELDGTALDADYWFANLRRTVLLHDTIEALTAAGHRSFLEVSAHPVLTVGVQEILDTVGDTAGDAAITGTLRRDEDEWRQ